jgi:hypothetical protein
MDKVIAEASNAQKKAQRLIGRVESAEQTSRVNAKSIPKNAAIRKEYINCGKPHCNQDQTMALIFMPTGRRN